MHMRGVYSSHMGGQRSHGAAQGKCILVTKGKSDKLVLEPLNFAGDIVRGDNCGKRPYSKIGRTHCL